MTRQSSVQQYTGVPGLFRYLLHHVTAYACRHKFSPLIFSSKILITWSILVEYAGLVHIQTLRIRRFGPFRTKKWTKPVNSSWFDATWSQTIRTRRFGPFFCSKWTKLVYSKSLNMDQTCVFDENWSCDQKFRRKSQWTKLVTACICCHVIEEVVDQTWDPRVLPVFIGSQVVI